MSNLNGVRHHQKKWNSASEQCKHHLELMICLWLCRESTIVLLASSPDPGPESMWPQSWWAFTGFLSGLASFLRCYSLCTRPCMDLAQHISGNSWLSTIHLAAFALQAWIYWLSLGPIFHLLDTVLLALLLHACGISLTQVLRNVILLPSLSQHWKHTCSRQSIISKRTSCVERFWTLTLHGTSVI